MKTATKAADNMFCKARYEAARFNERLSSREGASEELGIDRTRLARIELGVLTPYPEEVVLMAAAYRAPELRLQYCKTLCPLGKNFPLIQDATLDRISLEALSSFRKISRAKDLLLDITEDGIIDESEVDDLKSIVRTLEEGGRVTEQLKCWIEKNIDG